MAVPATETLSSADDDDGGSLLFARSVLSELSLEDIVESRDSYDELATITIITAGGELVVIIFYITLIAEHYWRVNC